jgi:hypothetical protein
LEDLQKWLSKFGLTLDPDKTRLIEIGRYAAEPRRKRGQGRPECSAFWASRILAGPLKKEVSKWSDRRP